MLASIPELTPVLRQYNPWWSGGRQPDLPTWRRAAFRELITRVKAPPSGRALLLSGARQIGKTTLFLQAIEELLKQGVPPANILYATFDHPLLKLVGLDGLLRLWRDIGSITQKPHGVAGSQRDLITVECEAHRPLEAAQQRGDLPVSGAHRH